MARSHRSRRPLASRPALALLALLACATSAVAAPPPLRVHFIDVGQADATLFEFPCGKAVLVDTGAELNAEFDGRKALTDYLDAFFAARPALDRTLALVAVTHPHIDHTRGVSAVLDRYRVQHVLVSGKEGSGSYWREPNAPGGEERPQGQHLLLSHGEASRRRSVSFARITDVVELSDAVIDPVDCRDGGEGIDPRIRVLWGEIREDPGWGYEVYDGETEYHIDNENNHSLALRMDYGDSSFLLTGDLEWARRSGGTPTAAIPDLLRRYGNQPGGLLDVDVYKVGHHGSANGTSEALLEAIRPEVAVLSMGPADRTGPWYRRLKNTAWQYGHPRQSVVADLESHVTLRRITPIDRPVATKVRRYQPMRIERCIVGTGWGGSVVVTAHADGRLEVAPAGGGSLCTAGGS
jgi:competence protein ComEC